MDSNKIISEWRGVDDDYDSLKAWTPELYQEIEDKGLWKPFIGWLGEHGPLLKSTMADFRDSIDKHIWYLLKSTPAQKSEALARAIMEVSQ